MARPGGARFRDRGAVNCATGRRSIPRPWSGQLRDRAALDSATPGRSIPRPGGARFRDREALLPRPRSVTSATAERSIPRPRGGQFRDHRAVNSATAERPIPRPRGGQFRDRGAVDEIAVGRAWASATSPRVTRGTASAYAPTAERSHRPVRDVRGETPGGGLKDPQLAGRMRRVLRRAIRTAGRATVPSRHRRSSTISCPSPTTRILFGTRDATAPRSRTAPTAPRPPRTHRRRSPRRAGDDVDNGRQALPPSLLTRDGGAVPMDPGVDGKLTGLQDCQDEQERFPEVGTLRHGGSPY